MATDNGTSDPATLEAHTRIINRGHALPERAANTAATTLAHSAVDADVDDVVAEAVTLDRMQRIYE